MPYDPFNSARQSMARSGQATAMQPPVSAPSGLMRQPENGLEGNFDMQSVLAYLQSKYPTSDQTTLQQMAQQQIQRSQQARGNAMQQSMPQRQF